MCSAYNYIQCRSLQDIWSLPIKMVTLFRTFTHVLLKNSVKYDTIIEVCLEGNLIACLRSTASNNLVFSEWYAN